MRRREFILPGGAAAAAWPFATPAQQAAMPVIGYLGAATPELFAGRLRAFRQGPGEHGYVNVAIDCRWAEGQFDRFPAWVADLIRRQVSVLTAPGNTPGGGGGGRGGRGARPPPGHQQRPLL